MSKITSKKISLKNHNQRLEYSKKLQIFEKEFIYPLGDKSFSIVHGCAPGYDYFSFFEQLGEVFCFVLEDNDKVIGMVCAVLRKIDGNNIWYLCDFKISPSYRGKKLYKQLMWKYFLLHYIKCQNMFALNMSSLDNNKLMKHTQNIFKYFNINAEKRFLHSFSSHQFNHLLESQPNIINQYKLISNSGKKDIIIDNKVQEIYHLVHKSRTLLRESIVDFEDISENAIIMLLNDSATPIMEDEKVQETTFICKNSLGLYLSSAEI